MACFQPTTFVILIKIIFIGTIVPFFFFFFKDDPNENIGFHNVVDGGNFQRKIEFQVLAHIVIYGIGTTSKKHNLHRM